jgi:hypothetical protein
MIGINFYHCNGSVTVSYQRISLKPLLESIVSQLSNRTTLLSSSGQWKSAPALLALRSAVRTRSASTLIGTSISALGRRTKVRGSIGNDPHPWEPSGVHVVDDIQERRHGIAPRVNSALIIIPSWESKREATPATNCNPEKERAVRFTRDVLGDPDRAGEIAEESLEDYAQRRKIQITNPSKRRTATMANTKTKAELEAQIADLQDENQELQDQRDAIADIVAPEEEDYEDDQGGTADDDEQDDDQD